MILFSTTNSRKHFPLRNSSNLHTLHAKTQLYFNSLLPSVIRDWNELQEEIRFSSSLGAFTYKLNRGVIMPPIFYFTGKRLGQIYHARLRTNYSSLNQHLFSKNIIDSPTCPCGAVENTYHYLFVCYCSSNLWHELFNTVSMICQPTLNVLLVGNDELSMQQSSNIFLAVQNFMLKLTTCWTQLHNRLYIVFCLSFAFTCINLTYLQFISKLNSHWVYFSYSKSLSVRL